MKSVRTSEKLGFGRKMKCAVVSTLILLAFVSQPFAVLRPLFPAKPAAPFAGEIIIIGDDFVLRSAEKRPLHSPESSTVATCLHGRLWPLG